MEFDGQMSNHFPTSSIHIFYWTLPWSLDPHRNAYIVKPLDYPDLVLMMVMLKFSRD